MSDSQRNKLLLKRSIVKRALARLINDYFAREGLQLVNNVMSIFSPHKQSPHGPLLSDDQGMSRACGICFLPREFRRWTVEERRFVSLAGVKHCDPCCPAG